MRVVVIGGHAPSLTRFRKPLLEAMVARGHEVIAMAADDGPVQLRAELAASRIAFEPVALERAGLDPTADLRTMTQLVRRFRRLRPELVLGYTIKPVIYGSLAARLAGVPRRAALITGVGYSFTRSDTLQRRVVATMARTLYRVALAGCQTVFFQNPDDQRDFERWGLIGTDHRVQVVRGSGVDLAYYDRRALPPGPPVFVFLGRMLADKGFRDYVAMAERVRAQRPEVRFCVAGWVDPNPDSVTQRELDRWCTDGVIEYLGGLEDIRPVLAASHVLVLPSRREGTPRTVLEAMAMGRVAITTNAPGCRETLVDGVSGLMVPVADIDALAAAALRLIDDPALIGTLAEGGYQRVRELYDARTVAAEMLDALGL